MLITKVISETLIQEWPVKSFLASVDESLATPYLIRCIIDKPDGVCIDGQLGLRISWGHTRRQIHSAGFLQYEPAVRIRVSPCAASFRKDTP